MSTKTNATKITTRGKACGCGCQGSDSWHKPTISRVIRDGMLELCEPTQLGLTILGRGVAQMPWGLERLVCVGIKGGVSGSWFLEEMKCGHTWLLLGSD